MAINKSHGDVISNIRKEVEFSFKDLAENAQQFSDWSDTGDRGIPFEFFDNEIICLPKHDDIRVWGRTEIISKKPYKMLYTSIESDRQGFVEVPLSIFRRIPALKEEIELLKQDNVLGAPLLSKMPDIKRLELLSQLAGENPIVVREVLLHRNGWDSDNNKPIRDDASKPENERWHIVCHRFNLA